FRDGGAIRVSRSLKELSLKAARVREELLAQGKEPRISDIAQRLGVTEAEAAEAVCAGLPPVSLTPNDDDESQTDVPVSSGEDRLIDLLALRQSLGELCEEDRRLIFLRYFRGHTQCKTAEIMGLTQVQVSRRERKILADLREKLV
ncbi:MAG: sigma factor-like helix-turn-helix DNA-binding protein, partial [Oscillospiraceae bacterium]